MGNLIRARAGRPRLPILIRSVFAGVLACAMASGVPANAAVVPSDAPCAEAEVWTTHATAAAGLQSSWQRADCSDAHAGVAGAVIRINPDDRQQRVLGFGAALTGSAAWLMTTRMRPARRRELIRSLFAPAPAGIGLSLLRLPIGSTDLSRRRYSLAPVPPGTSANGAIGIDLGPFENTTLPVLKAVLKVNPHLLIIASPWSAPAWMKSNGDLIGGQLQPSQELPFARYIAAFVGAMRADGVPIFAVTLQNEPGYVPSDYPGMRMDSAQRARVVSSALGPLLARTEPATTILEWDDNWDRFKQPLQVLADAGAEPYIGGVAWHCYIGRPHVQDLVHARHPDKWQLVTECSDGTWSPNSKESIADFVNRVLIQPTRHWGAGTILWSLALDPEHGPHSGGCGRCIGVVTIGDDGHVEPTRDYYALAHFSMFVAPGAHRVATDASDDTLANVGFISADGSTATVVIANRNAAARSVRIVEMTGSKPGLAIAVPPESVTTVQFPLYRIQQATTP